MPIYIYQGRNRIGQIISGETEVKNEVSLISFFRQQGIIPISFRKKPEPIRISLPFTRKIKAENIVIFTRQFATMINAGLPLVQCLQILEEQETNKVFAEVINKVKTSVEEGFTLANALSKHPEVFNELFVYMVEAGELGGVLDVILNRLALYTENAENLKRKIKAAMTYPIFVAGFAFIAVTGIIVFIIPTFKTMFDDFGVSLPLLTQLLLNISNFSKKFFPFIIGGIITLIIVFRMYRATNKGKLQIDKISLRLPVIGILLRKVSITKFTRTLGTLIASGVPILEALNITAKTVGNKIIENAILQTRVNIQEGKTITQPLKNTKVFPPMVCQMIKVGEETGSLEEMLNKVAEFYDKEVEITVGALTSIIEPILIITLGVVIGTIVIALFLPILTLTSQIKTY